MTMQTGQVIAERYRIVKQLGQGGFGAVYRAWDLNLKRPCAVKENLDTSPEAQRQFEREATILANLSHPNLPRVTDHFIIEDKGQYLVMDFVDGEDLGSRIQRLGHLPLNQSIEWISQVADALSYLHTRQPPVVHRDIKPANIRITPEEKVILVDFGLVKIFDPKLQTTMGARAVTPGYAPPEQYGKGQTDTRTDIYALGATLYKILTGQDPLESVQRIAGSRMLPAHQINPNIPYHISSVIERAMSLDPEQRYQDSQQFKTDLNAIESTILVNPVHDLSFHPAVSPSREKQEIFPKYSTLDRNSKTKQKSVWFWLAIIGVIVICLCVGASYSLLLMSEQSTNAEFTEQAKTYTAEYLAVGETSTVQAQNILNHQATLNATRVLVFGPTNGSLYHEPDDGMIEADSASVELRDFIVEAIFYNPYDPISGLWDYGFVLRHVEENVQFRFAVKSDQTWKLINNSGDPNGVVINSGSIPQLKINQDDANKIRLEFIDQVGYFYLNDEYISQLDISSRTNTGDIFIVTGLFEDEELVGEVTNYKDFTIWSLPMESIK
jgi:eukaryotic-like serine/threonine-protein kinase